eukprot:jgi/Galph1/1940/GphlegSOOS_G609.1
MNKSDNSLEFSLSAIVRALSYLHEPCTLQETRKEADSYLSFLKENVDVTALEQVPEAFSKLVKSNDTQSVWTKHFLLSLFESSFKKWLTNHLELRSYQREDLSEQNSQIYFENFVKPGLWKLVDCTLLTEGAGKPSVVKKKLVSVFSSIVLHTWPQYWLTLFDELLSLSQSNTNYAEFIFLLVKEITEELTSDKKVIEPSRRDELIRAFDLCLPSIFQFMHHLIEIVQQSISFSARLTPSMPIELQDITCTVFSCLESVLQICDLKVVWKAKMFHTLFIFLDFPNERLKLIILNCLRLIILREDFSDPYYLDEQKYICDSLFDRLMKFVPVSIILSLNSFLGNTNVSSDETSQLFLITCLECFRLHVSKSQQLKGDNRDNLFYVVLLLLLHPTPLVALEAVRFLRACLQQSSKQEVLCWLESIMKCLTLRYLLNYLQEKVKEVRLSVTASSSDEHLLCSYCFGAEDKDDHLEHLHDLSRLNNYILSVISQLLDVDAAKVLNFWFFSLYGQLLSFAMDRNRSSHWDSSVIDLHWLDDQFSWNFASCPSIYGTKTLPFEHDSNFIMLMDAAVAIFSFISNYFKKMNAIDKNQQVFTFYDNIFSKCYQYPFSFSEVPYLFLNLNRVLEICLSSAFLGSSQFSFYIVPFFKRLIEEVKSCAITPISEPLLTARTNLCALILHLIKIPDTSTFLSQYMNEFSSEIQWMIDHSQLSLNEQNLLAESVIVVSTALQDHEEQRVFRESMLYSAVVEFTSGEWIQKIRSGKDFVEFFLSEESHSNTFGEQKIRNRNNFARLVSLLDSVSHGTRGQCKCLETHKLSRSIFERIVDPLCFLLTCLHELRTPSIYTYLQNAELEDILNPPVREICDVLGFSEDMDPSDILCRHGIEWKRPDRDELRFWLSDLYKRTLNLSADMLRGSLNDSVNIPNFIQIVNALCRHTSDLAFREIQILLHHGLRPLFSGFVAPACLSCLYETEFIGLLDSLRVRLDAVLCAGATESESEESEMSEMLTNIYAHNAAKELFVVLNDIIVTHDRCQSSFSKENNSWNIRQSKIATKYYSVHDPLPVITENESLFMIIFHFLCLFPTWNDSFLQKKSKTVIEKLLSIEMPKPAKEFFIQQLICFLFPRLTTCAYFECKDLGIDLLRQAFFKCPDESGRPFFHLFPNLDEISLRNLLIQEKDSLKIPRKGKKVVRQFLKDHCNLWLEETSQMRPTQIPALPDKIQFQRGWKKSFLEQEEEDGILSYCSPSRQALLREWNYEFRIEPAGIDETLIRSESAEELVKKLAVAKAEVILPRIRVLDNTKPLLLVTADQVVVCQGKILEKPKDEEEARRFILSYSVAPAVTIGSVMVTNCCTGYQKVAVDKAEVYFRSIPENIIEQLIKEGDIFYCAGGLQVENPLVSKFVDHMVGTMDSVMGLSRTLLENLIQHVL